MNNSRYIENGRVKRSAIATDIMYRKLTRQEIEQIANDPSIQRDFFGTVAPLKCPQNQWSENYLGELSCAVVAQCFNREYLLYLDQVAAYVAEEKLKKRRKKQMVQIAVIIILVILSVIIYLSVGGSSKKTGKDAEVISTGMVPAEDIGDDFLDEFCVLNVSSEEILVDRLKNERGAHIWQESLMEA